MSPSPVLPDLYEPTLEERSSAMLPHILQIFGGFVPPLVVLILKRDSRYVRFHSLQALMFQAIASLLFIFGFVAFIIMIIATSINMPDNSKELPKAFIFFPVLGLLFFGQYGVGVLLAIIFGYQCSNGKWSCYPLIGKLALRWSNWS